MKTEKISKNKKNSKKISNRKKTRNPLSEVISSIRGQDGGSIFRGDLTPDALISSVCIFTWIECRNTFGRFQNFPPDAPVCSCMVLSMKRNLLSGCVLLATVVRRCVTHKGPIFPLHSRSVLNFYEEIVPWLNDGTFSVNLLKKRRKWNIFWLLGNSHLSI